jgi:NAD(P)-dependent dehydrogenase (short-subunit alcohol dehydrogenase family)
VKLAGCTALVTGANRGVGAALVDALFDRGAAKVYAGARELGSLVPACSRYGEQLTPIQLDVTKPAELDAAARACPDVDLLVGNAGITAYGRPLEVTDAVCREVFEVNVFGPLALVKAFAPGLRERQGGVLFINSVAGLVVSRSAPIYAASKAALRMLALGLREQLAADGVVVTISHPGFIDTEMSAGMTFPKASARQVAERSLDGWEAGATSVFPDRFAELVEQALSERAPAVLTEPQRVTTALVEAFQQDPRAGH